jgi:hypothetical protein
MPNDSQPEIITVNSEDLQATIRDLLPSQNGFGSELQASNVITPIIDLTPAAEGNTLDNTLQKAWDYSTNLVICENTTPVTIINQPGFWLVNAEATPEFRGLSAATPVAANISITDGATPKTVWQIRRSNANDTGYTGRLSNFVVFLRVGDSLTGYTNAATKIMSVMYRQIADDQGNAINPLGYSPL